MAYKRITLMDIWEIIRRRHKKQSISHISHVLGYDRKTVNKYIQLAQQIGIDFEQPLPPKEKLPNLFQNDLSDRQRQSPSQEYLQPLLAELTELVNDKHHWLKPKIAFEVLCQRHDLYGKVSYSSFKRFVRKNSIAVSPQKSTCRIEVEAGQEIQIDYAKVGLLYDPLTNKRRTAYAFIATLSHSRHKYIEFVYKQDQQSFVASHIKMFEYFGGVPLRILIDNLKSGVIKPDLYDPKLNRAYQEMAEFYDCFIDPCRVRHPKDKGKVERDVQTVRQQFRKFLALYPAADIADLNRLVRKWCTQEYGQRDHGTTHLKPYQVFIAKEQPVLKPLPPEPFEIARWKEATVHPDHYIQFDKKAYTVPHAYVGKEVWVKATDKIVQIYYREQLIKQHVITAHYRHTDFNDFPPNVKAVLDDPLNLELRAEQIGERFAKMIRRVLEPHAYINMRKAQGLLSLAQKHKSSLVEKAADYALEHNISVNPKNFKRLLENLEQENHQNNQPPLSQQSMQFVRPMNYFIR